MKKKAIKIAASTAVAASAFVAVSPVQQADAATNVNQLVTDAQNAGTVLKWAISVEGSADYETQPWAQYNTAKKAIAAAEAAAKKLSASEKLSVDAKLVEPKLQVKRAAAYIDAITSSGKIIDLTNKLDVAIKGKDLNKVEAAYHEASEEYRKQAALLDKVYGQSTRDGIRDKVKPTFEKLYNSVKYDVTVKMHLDKASALIKAGKNEEAAAELAKADYNLNLKEASFTFKTQLEANYADVAKSLPLSVLSVSRVDANTVTVKFSKEVDAVLPAGQFVFDNGLTVQKAVVSADRKTVTLTTSTQAAGTTYKLFYQGKDTGKSFAVAADAASTTFFVDEVGVARIETGGTRVYKVTVKNDDLTNYNGQVDIALNAAGKASLQSINGAPATGDTARVSVPSNGVLTIVINGVTGSETSFVPTVKKLDNNKVLELGRTYVYAKATGTSLASTTFTGFHDTTNNYFTVGGVKYSYDANDVFHILGNVVSLEQFKAALSYNDTVVATTYAATASNSSNFNITSDVTFSNVKVTNPSDDVTYDGYGFNYKFEGTGNNGYTVYLYNVNTGNLIGTGLVSNGVWSVQAGNLGLPGTVAQVKAVQVAPGQTVATAEAIAGNVDTSDNVYVGPFQVASASLASATTADSVVGYGDTINLALSWFDDKVNNDFTVGDEGTLTVKDAGSKIGVYKVRVTGANSVQIIDVISTETGFEKAESHNHRIISIEGIKNKDNLSLTVKENVTF
ncbi:hypothetical protein WAX74_04160 [Psychrobacillus sp. FJAT-51614]|uniref:SbsC C-terminal domain-containing protein n=1 Tax=Psychrobacillus mangrovi TaxID=3117745 RepID=A0ABU8F474_9BACI